MSSTGRVTLSLVRHKVLTWSTNGSWSSFSGVIRLSRSSFALLEITKDPVRDFC